VVVLVAMVMVVGMVMVVMVMVVFYRILAVPKFPEPVRVHVDQQLHREYDVEDCGGSGDGGKQE